MVTPPPVAEVAKTFGYPSRPIATLQPKVLATSATSRFGASLRRAVAWSWNSASLVVLLAIVTAIPGLQILSLGYLLYAGGRVASGHAGVHRLPGAAVAGQIGRGGLFLLIAWLPMLLLTHWQSVAEIIQPGSADAQRLRIAAVALGVAATFQLGWGAVRGGRLRDYLWPAPLQLLRRGWRPSVWNDAADRLWRLVCSLHLVPLAWLGVRAAVGTLIWIAPAFVIMGATRGGRSGAAGLVAVIAAVVLAWVLSYLPALQIHFADQNRFSAIFNWRLVRRQCHAAPWAWAGAALAGLVILPTPLYLLKIEAVLQEVTWVPCAVFIAMLLPARLIQGLALRRGRRLHSDPPIRGRWSRRWATASRWTVRWAVMPAIVTTYLLLLLVSQYAAWDGVETWVRQHALLVPVPFEGL